MSIDRWIDKETAVYTYTMEYYSAIKDEILPFGTTWTDLECIIQVTHRKTNFLLSPNIWNLKNKTNKTKQNHRYREQTRGCQNEGGGGMDKVGEDY